VGKRLQFVCLGYGKEQHAEDLLREGILAGNWVILQNCHMVPEWLPRWVLLKIGLAESLIHPSFQLVMIPLV